MSFTDAGTRIIEGVSAGLYESGAIIMAQSQVLVPVDTGTLKRSGVVEEPVMEGDSMSVTVGYGYGGAYAGRIEDQFAHDPDAEHGYGYWVERIIVRRSGHVVRHKPPTQARFLEVPAKAFSAEMPGVIASNIDAQLHS